MTAREFGVLGCRLLGAYIIIEALGDWPAYLGNLAVTLQAGGTSVGLAVLAGKVTSTAFFIGMGAFLWVRAEAMTARMLGKGDALPSRAASSFDFANIALTCMGAFALLHAIPDAVALYVEYKVRISQGSPWPYAHDTVRCFPGWPRRGCGWYWVSGCCSVLRGCSGWWVRSGGWAGITISTREYSRLTWLLSEVGAGRATTACGR